jgi:NitT/TauT family transport system permease protein
VESRRAAAGLGVVATQAIDRPRTTRPAFVLPQPRLVIGTLSVGLFLIVWQIAGSNEIVRSSLISYPTQILGAFADFVRSGELASNALVTLREFAEGFAAAVAGGVAIGLVFALNRPLRYLIEPLFVALNMAPMVAFVPLLIVLCGIDEFSKVVTVFLSAFIPIAINTTTGITQVHESWVRALRALGARKHEIVLKAMLPGALPAILTGIRLGIGRGIVVLIAAEMTVSLHGIGRLIQVYGSGENVAKIFVLVAVVAGFGFCAASALGLLEQRVASWPGMAMSSEDRLGRGPAKGWYRRHERVVLGVTGVLVLLAVWEFAVHQGLLTAISVSSPSRIAVAFVHQWQSGAIIADLRFSMFEFVAGFGLALVVGLGLGVSMGLYSTVEYAVDPFVWIVYSSPMIAFYPLLVIWLGFGTATVVAVTFLLSFVSIVVNTVAAVHAVDPQLVRAIRAYGGKQRDIIVKVILPSSLPLVLAGVRIGLGRAFLGVVLGEMFGANHGFGYDIAFYANQMQTTNVFVSLIILIAIGWTINQLSVLLENRLLAWRRA